MSQNRTEGVNNGKQWYFFKFVKKNAIKPKSYFQIKFVFTIMDPLNRISEKNIKDPVPRNFDLCASKWFKDLLKN